MIKNHIVFYSGDIGSWKAAQIAVAEHGSENVRCLFTDTLIEDNDLYRFMLEAWADIYKKPVPTELIERARNLTQPYENMDVSKPTVEERFPGMVKRKQELEALRDDAVVYFNGMVVWLSIGADPWDIYYKARFLGNSRIAKCSEVLKQKMARDWIDENVVRAESVFYMGIDWTEEHRTAAPRKNWAPATVEFPLCDMDNFVVKEDLFGELAEKGIELPELYKLGFSHNNCGGFCCRAGQGHFVNLLETKPELYAYHEQRERERELREHLGKDVAMMKKQVNKVISPLTMERLRDLYEAGKQESIDRQDIGGCGCFVTLDDE